MPENILYRFFFRGKSYLIPKDYIDHEHPGGSDEIMPYVDKDMTDAFEDADHSLNAVEMLEEWLDAEYDFGIPPDPSAVAPPAQEEVKTAGSVAEASLPAAAVTPAVPKAVPAVSAAPAATAPTTAREPSKPKLFVPAVATALMASIAFVYLRVTKRR
ncbi:hypothetical protein, unknown function [Leishmania mexicana MHOM/GT/2001/U1103]|uniref:Cytochrome b5 heme-binding domain-containing protein n=1 Tax=Leishmania mexicana (strain MHOM/GT/2001/U1103) TaxID=929439 RepID=E9B1R6_LEIMU|nr:hypothetical protein, unknown function [Leishmania mexicana MHOM/GT/2001/U1103]CBZ29173.1 hypothetical protein, unknown function [Leishmania mexicana MHOM/GT/2001/U1103]